MKLFGILLVLILCVPGVMAWGNGGSVYNQPEFANQSYMWSKTSMYGTHDYLAEYALKFLPAEERSWLANKTYLYGTELPDSIGYPESLSDRNAQYMTYGSKGLTDDFLAARAMKKYDVVLDLIKSGSTAIASKWAGSIVSYVADAGLFSRVIGVSENGLAFEGWINRMTRVFPSQEFEDKYGRYIEYDGSLEIISPYDAVARVAQAAYLGEDGACSAQWMEDNYDPNSEAFIACAGQDFNNIINAEADVLHTIYQASVNGVEYNLHAYDWTSFKVAEPPAEEQPAEQPPQQPPAEEPPQPETGEPAAEESAKQADGNVYYIVLAAVLVVLIPFIFLELKKMGKLPAGKGKPGPRRNKLVGEFSKTLGKRE